MNHIKEIKIIKLEEEGKTVMLVAVDKKLAGSVPEFKGIQGTTLKDHLPEWSGDRLIIIERTCCIR